MCFGLALTPGVASAATTSPSGRVALGDKTLVAWVIATNLTQRGGSVLTVIDPAERFDAVVLGEIAPGRWMAGSDFFRRTQRDQSAWPSETADARTMVQIAIAYQGSRISLFRNGKRWASYAVQRPQAFGRDASALIGLRYIGHMGEIGFFAGAVEEARIYNVALDEAAVAALQPNKPSDPKPVAQWTFEDGTAADAIGAFPPGRLCGGARIADGKLHLNGTDAYVIIERATPENQLMFYKPRQRQTGIMWDTWLFLHRGTYYLYYLAKRSGQWDNISMATSPDGVHWAERGPILAKAKGVTWMGTGSTWRSPVSPKDEKFQMNFSEWRGPRQTIFFAESPDLLRWQRLGDECEFRQDERWYERNGRWDCIWTLPRPVGSAQGRPGGGLYGYWTATPKPQTGGRFGFGETADGVRWSALPPPKVHGVGEGEVGAIERIGERYYMMFGTGGRMVTLVADKPEGPFHAAKRNLVLLGGHTYFSRFFPTPDALLVNHHSIARNGQVYLGTLKTALVDAEGTLRLGWWKGNERLKADAKEGKLAAPSRDAASLVAFLPGALDAESGAIVEGSIALPQGRDAAPVGLYIECEGPQGSAILAGPRGATELGTMRADGSAFKCEKRVDREMDFGPRPAFRLLLKQSLLEFYLNDILIECYSLPERASGRLGVIERGTRGAVEAAVAWQLLCPEGDPAPSSSSQ